MRLGLFGGRFDPPHVGHLLVAEQAREQLNLDSCWFIPSKSPPHKAVVAPSQARLDMTRLAIESNPYFALSTLEFERSGPSYTIDTVRSIQKAQPTAELFYILGADAYAKIATWHEAETLVKSAHMLVHPRPNQHVAELEETFQTFTQLQVPQFEISSTEIRKRLSLGQSVRYILPDKVYSYIKQHQLYEL